MTSGQVTDHFYANGLQVAQNASGTPSYFHEDALGSIRLVTTGAVSIAYSSNYLPFGLSVNATGIEESQYTGKPADAITGLYYFGARFYDPSIFRFITMDSQVGSPSDPLSQNRYIYARDNPETIMDPTGHDLFGDICSAVSNIGNQVVSAVSSATSAVTDAWNSLPPTDQAIVTTVAVATVAVAATVLTGGLATPIAADAIGTEVADIAATETVSEVADVVSVQAVSEVASEGSAVVASTAESSSFSASTLVTKSLVNGITNTISTDAINPQSTPTDLAISFGVGCFGGCAQEAESVMYPASEGIVSHLGGQAVAGIATETMNVLAKHTLDGTPLPPSPLMVAYGAFGGIADAVGGDYIDHVLNNNIGSKFVSGWFSTMATNAADQLESRICESHGVYLRVVQ